MLFSENLLVKDSLAKINEMHVKSNFLVCRKENLVLKNKFILLILL